MCFLGPQLHGVLVVGVSITEVNKKGKIKRKTSHGGCWISLNFAWRGSKSYFVFSAGRVPWVMSKVQLHHWILCLRIPIESLFAQIVKPLDRTGI